MSETRTAGFRCSDGTQAEVRWPAKMTPEVYEDFLYLLEGILRTIRRDKPEQVEGEERGEGDGLQAGPANS